MDVGETIRDVILRITGDGDDARRELERLAIDLTKFGRKEAEADAKINTEKAKGDLKALEAQFSKIDGRDLTATAKVRLGKAMAEVQALQAELDTLDGRDVNIDVNLQKDLEDRLQALGMKSAAFADHLGDVERSGKRAGETLADTNVNVGNMNTSVGQLVKILPVLVPLLVGFIAQVVALGASAIQAVGGLAALAVALGGALVSAVAIGGAAILRFKETMETAGTPAYKIVQIFGQIKEAASGLLKAADPILHAIANQLGGVLNVIEIVKPAFVALGKEAGQAVSWLVNALTSTGMAEGIAKLLELSGPVMKPLAEIAVYVGKILLSIANATMPLLVKALQDAATWLKNVTGKVEDLGATRAVVSGMVEHLKSWLNLLVQITGAFGALIGIAAPFGKVMVDTLAKGAEKLKEWLNSKEGTERVQQFFEDVLPLASEVAKAIGKIIVIFLQFGQIMAPVLKPIVAGFNQFLNVVIAVQEWLLQHLSPAFREIVGAAAALVFGFGKLKVVGLGVQAVLLVIVGALGAVGGAFGDVWSAAQHFIGNIPGFVSDKMGAARDAMAVAGGAIADAASTAFHATLDATKAIWGAIKDVIQFHLDVARAIVQGHVQVMRDISTHVWQGIRDAAANIWSAIRQAIANQIDNAREAVANRVQAMREVATNVWNALRDAAGNIFGSIRDAIANQLQNAREAVGNAVQAMRDVATNVWGAIRDAAANIFGSVKDAIVNQLQAAKDAVGNAVDGMLNVLKGAASAFFSAGVALIDNLINGFMSKVQELYDKVKGAVDKVTGLLPGSEPKDPSSPLRGLPKRGRAIIGNLVRGITEAGPTLVNTMSRELAAAAAAGPGALSLASTVDVNQTVNGSNGWAASQPSTASSGVGRLAQTVVENLNVTPIADGGSPDPEALAAQLTNALRARAAA